MASQVSKEYPAIKGLRWHQDRYFSFFIPDDWHKMEWSDGRKGVIYGPDPTDPLTVFAVDVKELGTPISPNDLDILAEGFFDSIERLPESKIALRHQQVTGRLCELEAKYTFNEQDNIRKCWVRVLYHQSRQIAMTAQGATPEKYDYWLPLFFEAMMTTTVYNKKPKLDLGG